MVDSSQKVFTSVSHFSFTSGGVGVGDRLYHFSRVTNEETPVCSFAQSASQQTFITRLSVLVLNSS